MQGRSWVCHIQPGTGSPVCVTRVLPFSFPFPVPSSPKNISLPLVETALIAWALFLLELGRVPGLHPPGQTPKTILKLLLIQPNTSSISSVGQNPRVVLKPAGSRTAARKATNSVFLQKVTEGGRNMMLHYYVCYKALRIFYFNVIT